MPGDRCRLGAGCVNGASPVLRGFKVSIEYASRPRAPDGKPVGNGEKIVYAKPERLCSTRPKYRIGRFQMEITMAVLGDLDRYSALINSHHRHC